MPERPRHWKLINKVTVPCDLWEWAMMFENSDRIVAQTRIGQLLVSTVFLGLDHNFWDTGPPILFETMIFDLDGPQPYCERCSTWDEAVEMHKLAVAHATANQPTAEDKADNGHEET